MTRRILPPDPADYLRTLDERVGRLERQTFPEPAPQPLVSGGGGGGSCTHIWGGTAIVEDGWEDWFGGWRVAASIPVVIPSEGRVHVTAHLEVLGGWNVDSVTLAPWMDGMGPIGMSLGPDRTVQSGPLSVVWVDGVDAGPTNLGARVTVAPSSNPHPSLMEVSISIIWSECGSGSNVVVQPL